MWLSKEAEKMKKFPCFFTHRLFLCLLFSLKVEENLLFWGWGNDPETKKTKPGPLGKQQLDSVDMGSLFWSHRHMERSRG